MAPARLRRAVWVGALGFATAIGVVTAANPFPGRVAPPVPSDGGAAAAADALAARERRALGRLEAAERLLRAQADVASATPASAPAPPPTATAPPPAVAVAPATTAPVTSSGSS